MASINDKSKKYFTFEENNKVFPRCFCSFLLIELIFKLSMMFLLLTTWSLSLVKLLLWARHYISSNAMQWQIRLMFVLQVFPVVAARTSDQFPRAWAPQSNKTVKQLVAAPGQGRANASTVQAGLPGHWCSSWWGRRHLLQVRTEAGGRSV